jgi:DNA-binding beta-propeller fold protein YncE
MFCTSGQRSPGRPAASRWSIPERGVRTATISLDDVAYAMAMSPGGDELYVATPRMVHVLDAGTHQEIGRVPLDASVPGSVALSPDGRHLYVAYNGGGDGAVAVIDTVARVVGNVIAIPGGAHPFPRIAIAPSGLQLYATFSAGDVTVIDAMDHEILARVPFPRGPAWGLAVDAVGTTLFLVVGASTYPDPQPDAVVVVDLRTEGITTVIEFCKSVPDPAHWFACPSPDGRSL